MLVRIFKIIESIDQHKPLDEDVGAWLKQGLLRCIMKGETLNSALNLYGMRDRYTLWVRNKHLLKAWLLINPELTDWERSKELHRQISIFQGGRWQNIMFDKSPPKNLSELKKQIFFALQLVTVMPTTPKGIHSAVNSVRQTFFTNP